MKSENRRLKIAYLTAENPRNIHSWSGITVHMAQALEKYCGDVSYLGPIVVPEKRIIGRLIHEVSKRLLKRNVAFDRINIVAKKHGRVAGQRLAGRTFDLIVAPIGTPEIAFLKTDIPIMIVEGATFSLLNNYYPQYSNLLYWAERQAYSIEQMAYEKASILIFPSEWAARSAIEDNHVEKQKVHVVPHGANLEQIPPKEIVDKKKKSDHCRLLFVGMNWERKGGDIAFETLLSLEEMGVQAELFVCGSVPPQRFVHERMTIIPYLDKSNEKERRSLEQLYTSSDFLLVPTRQECYGLVFCEASAYGLPSITTNTGGVRGAVRDGENGFTLPLDARGAQFAKVIAEIYHDEQRYAELVRSSRATFEKYLNWDVWGITVKKIINETLAVQTFELQHT
jgi:glycosyltransferase involved in cell wall biosynthesis